MKNDIITTKPDEIILDKEPSMDDLSERQKLFTRHYLKCLNATKSAELAGYAFPNHRGSVLMQHPIIKAIISQVMKTKVMSEDEVLVRLSELARLDVSDYVDILGSKVTIKNLSELDGKTHLIRRIRSTSYGIDVHFADSLQALIKIGEFHSLFVNLKIRIETGVEHELEDVIQYLEDHLPEECYRQVIQTLAERGYEPK